MGTPPPTPPAAAAAALPRAISFEGIVDAAEMTPSDVDVTTDVAE
jgi:hypothetical protein